MFQDFAFSNLGVSLPFRQHKEQIHAKQATFCYYAFIDLSILPVTFHLLITNYCLLNLN